MQIPREAQNVLFKVLFITWEFLTKNNSFYTFEITTLSFPTARFGKIECCLVADQSVDHLSNPLWMSFGCRTICRLSANHLGWTWSDLLIHVNPQSAGSVAIYQCSTDLLPNTQPAWSVNCRLTSIFVFLWCSFTLKYVQVNSKSCIREFNEVNNQNLRLNTLYRPKVE